MISRNRRAAGFTHLDLIVVLLLAPLMAVMALSCVRHRGHDGNRVKCASNLRQIGQAIMLYANENGGFYPRTYYDPGAPLTDAIADSSPGLGAFAGTNPFTEDTPVGTNNITAAIFLLLRTQNIGAETFICPLTSKIKDDFGGAGNTALNRCNFTNKAKHLSYSIANMYPEQMSPAVDPPYKLHTAALGPEFAVAADMNPGTKGAGAVLPKLTSASNQAQMRAGNSTNHNGDGQNVLFGDGHVMWQNNPLCGLQRDNMYVNARGQLYASPVDGNDSLLLPTEK